MTATAIELPRHADAAATTSQASRYARLVSLGYSPETSAILSTARVSLESIARLLVPDAV